MSASVQSMLKSLFWEINFIIHFQKQMMVQRGEAPYLLLSSEAKIHTQVWLQHLYDNTTSWLCLHITYVLIKKLNDVCHNHKRIQKVPQIGNKVRCNKMLLLGFIFEYWSNMCIFHFSLDSGNWFYYFVCIIKTVCQRVCSELQKGSSDHRL